MSSGKGREGKERGGGERCHVLVCSYVILALHFMLAYATCDLEVSYPGKAYPEDIGW